MSANYADRIAATIPLTNLWNMGDPPAGGDMDEITAYGAECARNGYNLGYATGSTK